MITAATKTQDRLLQVILRLRLLKKQPSLLTNISKLLSKYALTRLSQKLKRLLNWCSKSKWLLYL